MLVNQNTKKVIITGVLGFIGGHTAKCFQQHGYYVIGIDNKVTIPANLKFCNEIIISDFVDLTSKISDINNIDAIVHIAGTSLVGPSISNPGEYYDNNVAKTNKMLESLASIGWRGKIVFSSSAATYGNNCISPIKEKSEGRPVSPYGQSKKMCEYIISDHSLAHGHKGIALRYFNAAGCDPDGQTGNLFSDTHLIPQVISHLLNNQPFVINGNNFSTIDGTCIRDYLHVSDIATAHVKAIELCNSLDYRSFNAYNLGTGFGLTNLEIIKTVEKVIGRKLNYSFGPRRIGDADELVADPSSFKQATDWCPMHSDIVTIVKTTYNWMRQL
jgi:UDP-glucose-4-epimerase GalE